MDYHELIISRIDDLCKSRNLSYNRLARMSGLNQSTVDNIMRAQTKNPRIKTLHRIALGFSMTLVELLDFAELNEVSFDEEYTDEDL